jgi:hypothetical protein
VETYAENGESESSGGWKKSGGVVSSWHRGDAWKSGTRRPCRWRHGWTARRHARTGAVGSRHGALDTGWSERGAFTAHVPPQAANPGGLAADKWAPHVSAFPFFKNTQKYFSAQEK